MDKITIPSPNPDAEAGPDEQLLPEEEGRQTLHQKQPSRRRKTGIILLQIIALALAFITGSTAGYKWRGDLDHRCRNFEEVRRWAEENQLSENVPDDFLARPKRGDRVYEEIP
ncbi:hypothetical protein MAP00_008548 [Monascus purpureus]|nr:hypothetical protein MAP00_008548 [Monascus purpureus]